MAPTTSTKATPAPTKPPQTGIEIIEWKPFQKNTLRAFFGVVLPSGMVLHGCALHVKGDARWIGLPARKFKSEDGQDAWAKLVDFVSREAADKFREAVLDAIDRHKPETNAPPRAAAPKPAPAPAPAWAPSDEDIPF